MIGVPPPEAKARTTAAPRPDAPPVTSTRPIATGEAALPVGRPGSVLLAGNGLSEFQLGHLGAPIHAQVPGALVEVLLGPPLDVHPPSCLTPVLAGLGVLGPGIGRALLVLGLPVVTDLLEGMLECRLGDPVRLVFRVVLLMCGVERLLEGALGLPG